MRSLAIKCKTTRAAGGFFVIAINTIHRKYRRQLRRSRRFLLSTQQNVVLLGISLALVIVALRIGRAKNVLMWTSKLRLESPKKFHINIIALRPNLRVCGSTPIKATLQPEPLLNRGIGSEGSRRRRLLGCFRASGSVSQAHLSGVRHPSVDNKMACRARICKFRGNPLSDSEMMSPPNSEK